MWCWHHSGMLNTIFTQMSDPYHVTWFTHGCPCTICSRTLHCATWGGATCLSLSTPSCSDQPAKKWYPEVMTTDGRSSSLYRLSARSFCTVLGNLCFFPIKWHGRAGTISLRRTTVYCLHWEVCGNWFVRIATVLYFAGFLLWQTSY
jgi:hypothetical protein